MRQPWAWAIIMGYKDVENRGTRMNHRGPLLIHAAKQMDADGFQLLWELGVYRKLPDDLFLGGLIGSVEIIDCVTNSDSPWAGEERLALGDTQTKGVQQSTSVLRFARTIRSRRQPTGARPDAASCRRTPSEGALVPTSSAT